MYVYVSTLVNEFRKFNQIRYEDDFIFKIQNKPYKAYLYIYNDK